MRVLLSLFLSAFLLIGLAAQSNEVLLLNNEEGSKLTIDGQPFFINGMNWDYFPRGTNYDYIIWQQPEELIRAALDAEMRLLKKMKVNVVRQYTGVPAKWITYIYEKHGIYTMLNHSFGRYGLSLDGEWVANTDYADPRARKVLLAEVEQLARDYRNTPGLLMYLLGNENNYGLSWEGAETEAIPVGDELPAVRARAMYKLFNEAAVAMKAIDACHPVAICNGDLLYLDMIAEECPAFDVYGTNMYRGKSFGDAFERVRKEYGKPIMFTEFGADAYNAKTQKEDQKAQAFYMVENWQEIYANAAGFGLAENALGGFTFQFSDGWWKFGQTYNLDVHDNNASWPNGGYERDFTKGSNNMNEEWFGIAAKGYTNSKGLYKLYPRAAYYALKKVHRFKPFASGATPANLRAHFADIQLEKAVAKGEKSAKRYLRAEKKAP